MSNGSDAKLFREELDELETLVGEWEMGVAGLDELEAGVSFEWLKGRRFVVQRWEISKPEFPDGIAIIGAGDVPGTYLQHYFDSRGVSRSFAMTLTEEEWTLSRVRRETPSFFSQRFVGRFSDDGNRIEGRWEKADEGEDWELDFELRYTRRG